MIFLFCLDRLPRTLSSLLKSEFFYPFCAYVFDTVGLCCHIDEEHPVKAKNGVNYRSSNPSLKMLRRWRHDCLMLRFIHVLALAFFRCYRKLGSFYKVRSFA